MGLSSIQNTSSTNSTFKEYLHYVTAQKRNEFDGQTFGNTHTMIFV
jgi:hypothetical protein